MNTRVAAAVLSAGALIASLSACGGGGGGGGQAAAGGESTSCSAPIVNPDAPQVTVWAWYPNMESVVDNFNNTHTDVQVCWTNAGQGQDQYAKFQTAVSAGRGAPDVVMLEADTLPVFAIQDALVDLTEYGANEVKGNFGEGAWKDVSSGDAVYAIPVDGGPMAMMYRKDIFEQYGITPPTTWDEYRAAAEKVKAAGGPLFGDLPSNVPAPTIALMEQAGAQMWEYDASDKGNLKIDIDSEPAKKVLDYWDGLVQDGLVGTQDQFTTDYISGVVNGDYATYISAAWAPGYLTGAGAGEGNDKGNWAVAPLPQWDPANPVSVNWGGSTFAVTQQAENKELAAQVAMELYADDASLEQGAKDQVIFPLNQSVLSADWFINNESEFFDGQTANRDVYIPAANAYEGSTYSPYGTAFRAEFTKQLTAMNNGEKSGSQVAEDLHDAMVAYGKQQGFTVQE